MKSVSNNSNKIERLEKNSTIVQKEKAEQKKQEKEMKVKKR